MTGTAVFPEALLRWMTADTWLMYTGVVKETQPDGSCREVQTQCIASGDGTDYEKYAGNPVLDAGDLPEGRKPFRLP